MIRGYRELDAAQKPSVGCGLRNRPKAKHEDEKPEVKTSQWTVDGAAPFFAPRGPDTVASHAGGEVDAAALASDPKLHSVVLFRVDFEVDPEFTTGAFRDRYSIRRIRWTPWSGASFSRARGWACSPLRRRRQRVDGAGRARAKGVPFRLLNAKEAETIEALGETLVPGARDAGVAHSSTSRWQCRRARRARGAPAQCAAALRELYRAAIGAVDKASMARGGRRFAELSAGDQHDSST